MLGGGGCLTFGVAALPSAVGAGGVALLLGSTADDSPSVVARARGVGCGGPPFVAGEALPLSSTERALAAARGLGSGKGVLPSPAVRGSAVGACRAGCRVGAGLRGCTPPVVLAGEGAAASAVALGAGARDGKGDAPPAGFSSRVLATGGGGLRSAEVDVLAVELAGSGALGLAGAGADAGDDALVVVVVVMAGGGGLGLAASPLPTSISTVTKLAGKSPVRLVGSLAL